MSLFVVDVESDGPCPGLYSMVSFGAVRLDRALKTTFRGRTAPLDGAGYDPEALAVSGTTREQHLGYESPGAVMCQFQDWLAAHSDGWPVLISDNPAFDWQFVNYYFWRFCGKNPMGFSARRIGDLYAGLVRDAGKSSEWKQWRRTAHTHDPIDDAMGNAEALLVMVDTMGLKIRGL